MKEATEYHKQQLAAAHAENAELWKSNKMLLGQFAQEQAENAKLRQERDMMLEAFGKVPHLKPFIEEWLKTRQADINAKLKG